MDLSELKRPEGAAKDRRRVGRGQGSTLGKTCGKGQKGQKSRSGGSVHPRFEGGQMPIYRRLPKRGFRSRNKRVVRVVNVADLERYFDADATVDVDSLQATGLVSGQFDAIKILGDGELSKSLTVQAHAFSGSARQKIEAAGGTAEVI